MTSTAETIAGAISANSIQTAPVGLAKAVSATAFAKGATASISTLTLIKGALKIMAWSNAKTAIVAAVAVIVATGTATLVVGYQVHGQSRAQPQPQAVASAETNFPASTWIFAGYDDPQSAFLSVLWSFKTGDLKTFLASLTPSERARQLQQFKTGAQKAGKSLPAFFTIHAAQVMANVDGFRIVDRQVVADNQVILHVSSQGVAAPETEGVVIAKMIKTGNEWKLDSMGHP